MSTSIVACGASWDDIDAILGAKAVVSRFDIRRGCQVTVMESGKFLGIVSVVQNERRSGVLVLDDQNVIFAANTQL